MQPNISWEKNPEKKFVSAINSCIDLDFDISIDILVAKNIRLFINGNSPFSAFF